MLGGTRAFHPSGQSCGSVVSLEVTIVTTMLNNSSYFQPFLFVFYPKYEPMMLKRDNGHYQRPYKKTFIVETPVDVEPLTIVLNSYNF